MKRKSYSQILEHVARDQIAADTDLTPRILARIQKGKSATMQPRTKVLATVSLMLLILILGLVSVPAVRAAIQDWIGYAPGIGLVSEEHIRVLAEPVSVRREGITLTVEQVWAASDRTLIQYSVEGWPWGSLAKNPAADGCLDHAILRLPDHELTITQPQSSFGLANGYELKSLYPALPSTVDEVTFVMPCIILARPGEAPEDWEVPLRLVPAPADVVFPVIKISTPVEAAPTLPNQVPPQTNGGLATDAVTLVLDRAVQMEDGYLIYVTIHYENSGLDSIDIPFDPATFHLLDASGQEIAYELDWDATNEIQASFVPGQTAFAIKTAPIQIPGPLTLVLDAVTASLATDASFTFDPGPDPQPKQAWDLSLELDVGNGHALRVSKVTYDLTDGVQAYLRFDMESEAGVMYATLLDKAHPLTGMAGGGGGGSFSIGPFTSDLYYNEPLPKGPLTVTVTSISAQFPGHWEAAWTPPAPQAIPSSQSAACIDRQSWLAAFQSHASLPTGLGGTLAISALREPEFQYEVLISGLDGHDLQSIGYGFAPSLSPDGRRVAYIGPAIQAPADGIYITDLDSGNTALLPGTKIGDINPLWSPDGKEIAFTRGPSSGLIGAPGPYRVMLMDADGSNLRQLIPENEVNYAVTWMPDGKHLLYHKEIRASFALYSLDLETGEATFLFEKNYNGSVAVSPDGKRIAVQERLPLDKFGLFVSNLDGTDRIQLSDNDPYLVTSPAWGPDGNWLIVSVYDQTTNSQVNTALALVNVNDCQIIPLPNLEGYVFSWQP